MKTINNMNKKALLVAVAASMLSGMNLTAAPIQRAATRGDVQEVKRLLNEGVDVNAQTETYLWTPLHYAALNGHVEVAKLLLDRGARVNALTETKATPLHKAASRGKVGVALLLLRLGANNTLKDMKNQTAADEAREFGKYLTDIIETWKKQ